MQPKELDGADNPRAFWGSEVRRLREVAGLTQAELGRRAFLSGSYIGQFEVCARWPGSEEVPRMLDDVLGSDGHLVRLWHLGRRSTDYPDYFADWEKREKLAESIAHYSATVVAELLQTADYARALLEAGGPYLIAEEIDEGVKRRIERASLYGAPASPDSWFVIDENVLRRPVGGAEVMLGQLEHLTQVIRRRRIVIQVLPLSAGAHSLNEGSVCILRFADQPTVAYLEGPNGGLAIDRPEQIAQISLKYDLARAAALSQSASLDFIRSVMEDYRK